MDQVARKGQPSCSQPRPAMPGWCLTKQSLFYAQLCSVRPIHKGGNLNLNQVISTMINKKMAKEDSLVQGVDSSYLNSRIGPPLLCGNVASVCRRAPFCLYGVVGALLPLPPSPLLKKSISRDIGAVKRPPPLIGHSFDGNGISRGRYA